MKLAKYLIPFVLVVSAFGQTTVTMSRFLESCTPAAIPYLSARWTYPGCNTVAIYKYGGTSGTVGGTTTTWSCRDDVTLDKVVTTAKCLCEDTWRAAATLTAIKLGSVCTPNGQSYPQISHRCQLKP
jgi:hypothetical protein